MVSGIIVAFYSDRNLHIFDSVIYYFHINIALGFEFIIFVALSVARLKPLRYHLSKKKNIPPDIRHSTSFRHCNSSYSAG